MKSIGLGLLATAVLFSAMPDAYAAGGSLKCWGRNMSGELGNGTTTDSGVPVAVSGMKRHWWSQGSGGTATAVASGAFYTCALQNGALKCWGINYFGQLGNGTTTGSSTPVAVSGMESGVTALSAGYEYACALQNGALKCWGDNSSGQLGNGSTTNSSTPIAVSGMESGVTAVSTGISHHTCALQNGTLKCWGQNYTGQLGNGTTTDSGVPVAVSGMESGVTAFSAGGSHTCAIR